LFEVLELAEHRGRLMVEGAHDVGGRVPALVHDGLGPVHCLLARSVAVAEQLVGHLLGASS
jgi:hypothetical protein